MRGEVVDCVDKLCTLPATLDNPMREGGAYCFVLWRRNLGWYLFVD